MFAPPLRFLFVKEQGGWRWNGQLQLRPVLCDTNRYRRNIGIEIENFQYFRYRIGIGIERGVIRGIGIGIGIVRRVSEVLVLVSVL